MCSNRSTDKIIPVKENSRRFQIKNNTSKTVNIIHVDGCLIGIVSPEKRCDYVFEVLETDSSRASIVLYVELKGRCIQHAYEQIVATLNYLKSKHSNINDKRAFIVASRVPRGGAKVQNLKLRLAKSHKIQLTVKTQFVEVTI